MWCVYNLSFLWESSMCYSFWLNIVSFWMASKLWRKHIPQIINETHFLAFVLTYKQKSQLRSHSVYTSDMRFRFLIQLDFKLLQFTSFQWFYYPNQVQRCTIPFCINTWKIFHFVILVIIHNSKDILLPKSCSFL